VDKLVIVVILAAAVYVVFYLFRSRSRRMKEAQSQSVTAVAQGLAVARDLFEPGSGVRAPVESFHVVGNEARVTFDVPLGDSDDPILHDLLADEAIEVVREKRHTLPIDDVDHIVIFAGRDPVREVARRKLHAPGVLPEPVPELGVSFAHIAHDPFAAPFEEETDHSVHYGSATRVPADELGPISDELKIPAGLDRGMRALGTDPAQLSAPDFVLTLLKMFGYAITEQAYEGSFMAVKGGVSTYIETDVYEKGNYPELEEKVIHRFLADFGSSGADRGMLVSDRYSPFMIYDVEANQPKVRFVTRERVQGFIDTMALG
jgi:hypothetical protein